MLFWTFNITLLEAYVGNIPILKQYCMPKKRIFYVTTRHIKMDKTSGTYSNLWYFYLESVSDLPWLPPPPVLSGNRLWLVNWRSASGWPNGFTARWLVTCFEPRRDWLNWRLAPLDWLCGAGGRLCVCLGSCNIDIISSLDKDCFTVCPRSSDPILYSK